MNEYTKVADLNHEIEAQIMEDILTIDKYHIF